jgi:hypothetical protein
LAGHSEHGRLPAAVGSSRETGGTIAAGHLAEASDALSDSPTLDLGAELDDGPGDLVTQHGSGPHGEFAGHDMPIGSAHTRCIDLQQNLVGRRSGIFYLFE